MKSHFFVANPGWALRIFSNHNIKFQDVTFWFDDSCIQKTSAELLELYIRSKEPESGFTIRLYNACSDSRVASFYWQFFLVDFYKKKSDIFPIYLSSRIFKKFNIAALTWKISEFFRSNDFVRKSFELKLRAHGEKLIEVNNFFEGECAIVFANLNNSLDQAALNLALGSCPIAKSFFLVPTWDYLTTKGPILGRLETIFLWNKDQLNELARYHDDADFEKLVVGSLNFSGYLRSAQSYVAERSAVKGICSDYEKQKFDLLFLGSTKSIDPNEALLIEKISNSVSRNEKIMNFYYKAHPTRYKEILRKLSWDVLTEGCGAIKFNLVFSPVGELLETLSRNTLVVGVNSSSMWEFAIFGYAVMPVVPLSKFNETVHERYIRRAFGQPLEIDEFERISLAEFQASETTDNVYEFIFGCPVGEIDWRRPLAHINKIPGLVGISS